jgi:CelD/BcsL family acetyltransferase involved in cellulose biosynthesis
LETAIKDFCEVYARSWKKPEPYPEFITGLCRLAHGNGWLRMGIGYLAGAPVTAQIWLVKSGVASIYKLAYDQEHARLGVGTWMSAALTEYVLDVDRVKQIDFLAGDDHYKAEWMDCRRERFGVIAFRRSSLRGLVAAGLHFGARILRRHMPLLRRYSLRSEPEPGSS